MSLFPVVKVLVVVKRSVCGVAAAGVLSVGLLVGVTPVVSAPAVAATGVQVDPLRVPTGRDADGAERAGAVGAASRSVVQRAGRVKTYKFEAGKRYRLRGRVTPRTKRPVVLSERKGRRWKKVAAGKSAKNGKFAFVVAAGSRARTRQFTITVPRYRGMKGYSTRFNVKVTVAVAPTPVETPTTVNVGFSTTTAVSRSGQAFTVTGSLTGAAVAGRGVVLQQAWADGWHDVASATTAADGTYALALPATWLYTSQMRVLTRAVPGSAEGASAPVTVSSTPGWAPQGGNAAAWAPLSASYRTRWNPCQTITVEGNFAQAPPQAREAFTAALADLSEATGVQFTYVRDSAGFPEPEPGVPGFAGDVALGMAWTYDNQTKWDMSTALGVAGPYTGSWGKDAAGRVALATRGYVAMNPAYQWTYARMLGTYRHELSHVMGLGHTTADSSQLMWWQENGFNTFGVGDLAGLAAQGAQAGCVGAWTGLTAVGSGPKPTTVIYD